MTFSIQMLGDLASIRSFAEEIRYEPEESALVNEHLPRKVIAWNLSTWVEINPSVQFGAPIVRARVFPLVQSLLILGLVHQRKSQSGADSELSRLKM